MRLRARNGFTLLELLLAISLLSLITSSILGGIHMGRRTWEATRASEALDEVENALRSVTMLFAHGYPMVMASQSLEGTLNAGQTPSPFAGTPDACRFIFLSEGGAQYGGLLLTEIGGDKTPEGPELAVWTEVFRTQPGFTLDRESMRKTVILKDVASFELSYFGFPEQGKPGVWLPNWSNRATLPKLVTVKIGANRLGRVIEASATVAIRQQ